MSRLITRLRKLTDKKMIVKLTPNVTDITVPARAAVESGADALSLINTLLGMAVDARTRRPKLARVVGGYSGPAVKPVALRMVWQAVGAVNIPVVGLGGIATGRDALEFIMAGAAAVQVGAANFANPRAMETIADEMAAWMDKNGVKTLDEIRGCARNAE